MPASARGLGDLGLKMLLPEKYMSNTVTSYSFRKAETLSVSVRNENRGYVGYSGKGK
jgi:hypothetical protein